MAAGLYNMEGADPEFDALLTQEQQQLYDQFFTPEDSKDYDMRGYFRDQMEEKGSFTKNAEGQHYPDTYKKPNHPTFSEESIFHGMNGHEGGRWEKNSDGSFTFFAGPTNLKNHTPDSLIDYFSKYEKGNKLVLPGF